MNASRKEPKCATQKLENVIVKMIIVEISAISRVMNVSNVTSVMLVMKERTVISVPLATTVLVQLVKVKSETQPKFPKILIVDLFVAECTCFKEGTESCNKEDGKCTCKAYVSGDKCTACEDGYYGYPPNCTSRSRHQNSLNKG